MTPNQEFKNWRRTLYFERKRQKLRPSKVDMISGLSSGVVTRNETGSGRMSVPSFIKWANALGYELKFVKKGED